MTTGSLPNNILEQFNINISGKGSQPLIFAHGLGCDQKVWRHVSPAFENDYKIILFDYIGSGKSNWKSYDSEKYNSLNGYADDILLICDALELKEVIFVGHSVSSMIGVLSAIKKPELFSKLILIGGSPSYLNQPPYYGGFDREDVIQLLHLMKENYSQWANAFAPQAMANTDKPQLTQDLESSFCAADPYITSEFARVAFLSDNRNDLKKVTTPSLVMQPSEDIVAPTQVGEYLQKNIPGSTIYYMKSTGHFPHLSGADETINLIRKYLETGI